MNRAGNPLVIEGASDVAGALGRAFETWAGAEHVRVFFEPEPVLAADRPDRRGYLYDETYFVTIWVAVGGDERWEVLRHELGDPHPAGVTEKDPATEPRPERMLALVLGAGIPIEQVRHLL